MRVALLYVLLFTNLCFTSDPPHIKITKGAFSDLESVEIIFIHPSTDRDVRVDDVIAVELAKHIPNFQRYGLAKGIHLEIDYTVSEMVCTHCDSNAANGYMAYGFVLLRTKCDILGEMQWSREFTDSPEAMARQFALDFMQFYSQYKSVKRKDPVPECNCDAAANNSFERTNPRALRFARPLRLAAQLER